MVFILAAADEVIAGVHRSRPRSAAVDDDRGRVTYETRPLPRIPATLALAERPRILLSTERAQA